MMLKNYYTATKVKETQLKVKIIFILTRSQQTLMRAVFRNAKLTIHTRIIIFSKFTFIIQRSKSKFGKNVYSGINRQFHVRKKKRNSLMRI